MKLRAILATALLSASFGHATAKDGAFQRPAYAGAYEPQGVDERGLWMELDDHERGFRDSPLIIRDEELTKYIKGVLCKAVGPDRCGATRVYIVQDKDFNASMGPNGLMLVHTGLLARVNSEAELATVLGHEFAHFELRHSLNGFKKRRTGTDIMAWVSLSGAALGQNTAAAQTSLIFGIYGFNREQERQADQLSADYIRASSYPLRASIVWRRLMEEGDALREERKLRKIKRHNPGPTDTHPTNLERFAYFSELETLPGASEGDDGSAEYRAATARLLPTLFDSLVKSNEFAGTDYVIQSRANALGWDGLLLHARGELYRLRGNPRDLITARQFYEQSIATGAAPAEAWRGAGLTAMRGGDSVAGKAALQEYLVRLPHAPDAAAMKMLLEN
ncbi:MAG: M48 family metalloprotease [Sphingopyxis sp.]|nr:M48 family metalloprotease [Sphingopyxis sp.]